MEAQHEKHNNRVLAWYAFSYVWKLAGGTFVNGREIIYNGNIITTVKVGFLFL